MQILRFTLEEIPKFLITYFNLLSSPRDFTLKIISVGAEEELFRKALLYFFICYVLMGLCQVPVLGDEDFNSIKSLLADLLLGLTFLIFSTAATGLSWRIMGFKQSMTYYLTVACYLFGTILLFAIFSTLLGFSLIKYFNPETVVNYIKYSRDEIKEDPFKDYSTIGSVIDTIVYIAMPALSIWWFFIGWGVFRIKNKASKKQSFFAGLIFILLLSIAWFLYIQIEDAVS